MDNVPAAPGVLNKRVGKRNPDVLYIAGWAARYERPEIVDALAVIFDRLGLEWSALENECCGIELLELGYTGEAREQAQRFAKSIEEINPPKYHQLVSPCLPCSAGTVRRPGHRLSAAAGTAHRRVSGGRSRSGTNFTGGTEHRCSRLPRSLPSWQKTGHLRRARKLIRSATGSVPLELFHNRESAECCGAGSVMLVTEPELARKVARRRMENVRQEGIKTLITACGNCKTLLLGAEEAVKGGIAVMDIAELVAAALRDQEKSEKNRE